VPVFFNLLTGFVTLCFFDYILTMVLIEKIDTEQRRQVIAQTHKYIETACDLYNREFEFIPISFNLSGRAAGMYKVSGKSQLIRYNPYIFHRYFEENMQITVPHEVAHYVTDKIYGHVQHRIFSARRIKPHGVEWQSVMAEFGVDASRTCSFNLDGLPVRQYKNYLYACQCRQHQLGSRRHNKVVRKQARYHCRACGGPLILTA
jgi:SprT protein